MQSGKFKVAKWRSMLDQGSKEVGGRSDQIKAGNTSAKCHREVQSSKCDPPRSAKCDPKAIRWKAADTSARVQSAKCKGAKSFPTNFRLAKVKSASGTTLVQTSSHYCFFPSPFHLCYTPPNSQKVAKHILNKCLTVLSSVEVGGQGWPNFNRF